MIIQKRKNKKKADEMTLDQSRTEAKKRDSVQTASTLQQLNHSLLSVPPGLLQGRAPPSGGKTKDVSHRHLCFTPEKRERK